MDGFETAAAIRRRQKTRYVPIIFVTGQDTPERSLEAYSAGAVDYIVKPFDPAVLRSKLAVFIDLHRLRKHIAEELSRPYPGGLELGASVGVAFTANPAATTPDGLIRRADHAMYRSKRPGARRAEVSRVRPGLISSTSR